MTASRLKDRAAALIVASATDRIEPLLMRSDEALRRSRELLRMPIYPHDHSSGCEQLSGAARLRH